jgi:fermentation-respiration switch protein FrsA (DUF1100 family)
VNNDGQGNAWDRLGEGQSPIRSTSAEFIAAVLSSIAYGGGDAAEILSTINQVAAQEPETWFSAWTQTARQVMHLGEEAEVDGHEISAGRMYLRASFYAHYAYEAVRGDGTDRDRTSWRYHRRLWDRFCSRFGATPVEIGMGEQQLPGYLFMPEHAQGPLPLVIVVRGLAEGIHQSWPLGVADALSRGYAALAFDGPGQGAAFFERDIVARHDWEVVISAVIETMADRPEIDEGRIMVVGVDQGSYFALRAAAFDHRLAAVVADPGVMNLTAQWSDSTAEHNPAGRANNSVGGWARFWRRDKEHELTARHEAALLEPYGLDSRSAALAAVAQHDLHGVVEQIRTPTLITEYVGEPRWPGQSRELFYALTAQRRLAPFRPSEGGGYFGLRTAPHRRNEVIFDWFEELELAPKPV